MREIRVDKLKLNLPGYCRAKLDLDRAQVLADAIKAGVKLPPILIRKGTLSVVDGFVRVKAMEFLTDGRGLIACVERDYATDADAFLDAVRINAVQGVALNDADRARVTELAAELEIDPRFVAKALSVTPGRYGQLIVARRPAVASDLTVARRHTSHYAPTVMVPTITAVTTSLPRPSTPATAPSTPSSIQGRPAPIRVPAKIVIATDTLLEFLDTVNAPYSDPRLLAGLVRLKQFLDALPQLDAIAATAGSRTSTD